MQRAVQKTNEDVANKVKKQFVDPSCGDDKFKIAQKFYKSCKGWGTDEAGLFDSLKMIPGCGCYHDVNDILLSADFGKFSLKSWVYDELSGSDLKNAQRLREYAKFDIVDNSEYCIIEKDNERKESLIAEEIKKEIDYLNKKDLRKQQELICRNKKKPNRRQKRQLY